MASSFAFHSVAVASPAKDSRVRSSSSMKLKDFRSRMDQAAMSESIRHVMLNYDLAGTPQRFADLYLKSWRKEDQLLYLKSLRGMKTLPRYRIENNDIVFKEAGRETKLEFIPGLTTSLVINGTKWSYDETTPLAGQIEGLLKKESERPSHSLVRWLLPEAQAEPISLSILVGALVTGIIVGGGADVFKKLSERAVCAPTRGKQGPNTFQPRNVGFCEEWDKHQDELSRKKSPRLDAIKQMIASDNSNTLTKFKVDQAFVCPNNNDSKERIYESNLTVVQTGRKVKVKVLLTPSGDVKDFSIFNIEGDRKLAKILFDSENYMKCAEARNRKESEASSDPLSPQGITLCPENSGLTTEERAKLDLLRDLALYTNSAITKCTIEAVSQKVAEGKLDQVGSPMAPKAQDKAVVPAPLAPSAPAAPVGGKQ